ncbi:MAG: urease accessory protein UreE, partial [Methylotenera sp.]|nr:urease accessory protein UreE [Methylotenera sp.]
MININKRLSNFQQSKVDDQLVLPFDLRQRSRLRVTLSSGREAALLLDRGIIMRGGDLLETED